MARRAQLEELLLEPLDGVGVEPAERLVEQQQVRLVEERAREGQALAHAARVRAHGPAAGAVEPGPREQPCDPRGRLGDAEELRIECQVLCPTQVRVAGYLVAGIADPAAKRRRRPRRVRTEQDKTAARRREQQRQDAEQRGLAGAVRAEQHDHLARRDGEIDARQHPHAAEAADDALGAERRTDH